MRTCPSCGTEDRLGSRFCMACGTPLDRAAAEEERRLVTVLFADIAGFGDRFERADPEDIGAALRPFHRLARHEIESYGGTVDKIAGDVVFGVFGAPRAHEDDAERAVRAGLALLARVRELDPGDPARSLGARVAIATGEAMVAAGTGPRVGERVAGDIVNVASRLQTIAPPGSVVVAEGTFLATRSQFRWEELPPVEVKGKAQPLPIWHPVAPVARVGVDPFDPLGAPFTGREAELGELRRVFEHVHADRRPRRVAIVGEPGIGKSRVIAELSRHTDQLPDLIRWRVGRPSAYGQAGTFGPLADIVKAEAGVLDSDEPDVALDKLDLVLARMMAGEDDRARVRRHLGSLLVGDDGPGGVSIDEAFTAWAAFLEALASEHTTVLVFEDMHEAAAPMLDLLDALTERDRPVPLLVLMAARPELLDRRPEVGAGTSWSLLRIGSLSMEETGMLVRRLHGPRPLARDRRDEIVRRAGGNPLYAEELTRMAHLPAVPPTIHALLASRLDALSPELRSAAQDAAVVGPVVWAGAVAHAAGTAAGTEERLRALVGQGVLRPVRVSSVDGQEEFAFRHVLVREVAYGRIPRADRARKHAAVAGWLDRTLAPGADRDERLAFHYAEALELASAAGAADVAAEVLGPAIDHLLAAAAAACRLDATRAHTLYRRALVLMPAGHPERARALRGAGGAAQAAGGFEEADANLREAIAAFEDAADVVGAADARVALARSCFERGEIEPVHRLLEEALARLDALPHGPEYVTAATRMAGHLWVTGDHAGSIRWADRALELAASLDLPDQHVVALQYRGASRSTMGDQGGLDDLREALRIGRARDLGEETALAANNYAYELWFHRGAWASLDAWEETLAFCEERGLVTSAAWARSGLLEPLFDLGAWDRALSVAAIVRAWDEAHGGQTQPGAVATTFQGWVALRRGDAEGAAAAGRRSLARADQLGTSEYRAPAHVLAAEVAWAGGDRDEALRHLGAFLEVTEMRSAYRIIVLPMVVRLLVAADEHDEAAAFTDPSQDDAAVSERLALSLLTARATLAGAMGRFDEALVQYEEAVRRWDRYGFPVETARCGFEAGRCVLALGRPDEALRWFSDARSTFEALGARPWLEEADRAVSEVTSAPRR